MADKQIEEEIETMLVRFLHKHDHEPDEITKYVVIDQNEYAPEVARVILDLIQTHTRLARQEAIASYKKANELHENAIRIDELERIMKGEKTVTQFVGDVDDIITYVFSAQEIKERLAQLKSKEGEQL